MNTEINTNEQTEQTNAKIHTFEISINESTGQITTPEHFTHFLNALASSIKYGRAENLEHFKVNRKLFETLVPCTKTSAKTALMNGKIKPTLMTELQNRAGYEKDGTYLKQITFKG